MSARLYYRVLAATGYWQRSFPYRAVQQLVSLTSFPGVIVHELAHAITALCLRGSITQFTLFRLGNPSGYIRYAIHPDASHQNLRYFLIGAAPLVVNTILAYYLISPLFNLASVVSLLTSPLAAPLESLKVWLGMSLLLHAVPSVQDLSTVPVTLPNTDIPDGFPIVRAVVTGMYLLAAIFLAPFALGGRLTPFFEGLLYIAFCQWLVIIL